MGSTENPKFLADFMVGSLGRWLRILGFDAEYYQEVDRRGILYRSLQEKRIILTRDHLLSRKRAWKLTLIKSDFLEEQLEQVKKDFCIELDDNKLLSICTICNVQKKPIEKAQVKDKVPPYIYETHEVFSYCPKCSRIYWAGTHVDFIKKRIGLK